MRWKDFVPSNQTAAVAGAAAKSLVPYMILMTDYMPPNQKVGGAKKTAAKINP